MSSEFDEIYYYVRKELYCDDASNTTGRALSEVIAIALEKLSRTTQRADDDNHNPIKYWKRKITARLIDEAIEYPEDFYCLIDGKKHRVVKGNKKITLPQGKTPLWVIRQKPEQPIGKMAAFSLAVMHQHAEFLLPIAEREAVEAFVVEHSPDVKPWLDRIVVRSRYIPMFLNSTNEEKYKVNEEVVIDAIIQEKGFKATYQESESRTYYPYKLERREWVTYVRCYTPDNDKCKSYAIHRLKIQGVDEKSKQNIQLLDRDRKLTQKYLNSLEVAPGVEGEWGKLKLLKIRISGKPAQHLSEMRFHGDSELSKKTKITAKFPEKEGQRLDWVELEIQDIQYDYEFKCWLLGLGAQVTVLKYEADPRVINCKNINPKRDLIEDAKKILENHGLVIDS